MGVIKLSTMSIILCVSVGCSSKALPDPPQPPQPAAKTVFDPLIQSEDRARAVQQTVDQNTENTREAVDNQERGDSPQ